MLQFGKVILLDSIIFVNIHFSIEVEFGKKKKSPVKSRVAKANLELPKQFALLYFRYQFKNKKRASSYLFWWFNIVWLLNFEIRTIQEWFGLLTM